MNIMFSIWRFMVSTEYYDTKPGKREACRKKSEVYNKSKKTTFVEKSTRVFVVVLVLRIYSAN